ncbi:hypothetical protein PR001_g28265 [Phytophthora rubi]|uniref:Uncharacterized protein n=1 Tax=Phytophthora rubi TaxID=129364 RepID=A0A6A3HDC2_9STRA|nr:hypothetical protein PR001_g28265 [Phytophthora rubi]
MVLTAASAAVLTSVALVVTTPLSVAIIAFGIAASASIISA